MPRPLRSIWRLVHTTIGLSWNLWRCSIKMQGRGRLSFISDVCRSTGKIVVEQVYVETLYYKIILIIHYYQVSFCYRIMFKRISMTRRPRFPCLLPFNSCGSEPTIGQMKKIGSGGTHILSLTVIYKSKLLAAVKNLE